LALNLYFLSESDWVGIRHCNQRSDQRHVDAVDGSRPQAGKLVNNGDNFGQFSSVRYEGQSKVIGEVKLAKGSGMESVIFTNVDVKLDESMISYWKE